MIEPGEVLSTAADKLARGDITCVVAVDEIPSVLQRVVEFVNDHADFTLLAMQIEVMEHGDDRLVVPTVTGATVARPPRKAPASFAELLDAASEEYQGLMERIEQWADAHGHGRQLTRKTLRIRTSDDLGILVMYPSFENVELSLTRLHEAGMSGEAQQLRERLTQIAGSKVAEKFPQLRGSVIAEHWDQFAMFLDEFVAAKRTAQAKLEGAQDTPI